MYRILVIKSAGKTDSGDINLGGKIILKHIYVVDWNYSGYSSEISMWRWAYGFHRGISWLTEYYHLLEKDFSPEEISAL